MSSSFHEIRIVAPRRLPRYGRITGDPEPNGTRRQFLVCDKPHTYLRSANRLRQDDQSRLHSVFRAAHRSQDAWDWAKPDGPGSQDET